MNIAGQFAALLRMNLAGIPQRLGLVSTIVVGVTCAVGVLVSMLAIGVGARREALGNVRADRVILLQAGAPSAFQSSIPKDQAAAVRELPGIKRNAQGEPIVVPMAAAFVQARNRWDRSPIGFPIGGVTAGLTDFFPELHLTKGRLFQPGLHELIASDKCAQLYSGFATGDTRHMQGGDWRVVGNFVMGNTEGVCIVYTDADTLQSAFHGNSYLQIQVMLQSPASIDELRRAIKANPTLKIDVQSQQQFAENQSAQLNGILRFVSYFVGSIMALAATVGAANSLYAIVDGRRRELATLRALGFDNIAIVASMLLESILLALPGALIGALAAWLLFNGFLASPMGTALRLDVTPSLALLGLGWALAMGLLAGLLPALRAARAPVTMGLRAM
jgi:putative ABC transport system permease protein